VVKFILNTYRKACSFISLEMILNALYVHLIDLTHVFLLLNISDSAPGCASNIKMKVRNLNGINVATDRSVALLF
jgi:hypothetical protein